MLKQIAIRYTAYGDLKEGDEFIRVASVPVLLKDVGGRRDDDKFIPSGFGQTRPGVQKSWDIQRMVRLPGGGLRGVFLSDMVSPEEKLKRYLDRAQASEGISPGTASFAWSAWEKLREEFGQSPPVPDADYGPNGELLYCWNDMEHHLELEILPDQKSEFFYMNRETNETWSSDFSLSIPLPAEVLCKLRLFVE